MPKLSLLGSEDFSELVKKLQARQDAMRKQIKANERCSERQVNKTLEVCDDHDRQ